MSLDIKTFLALVQSCKRLDALTRRVNAYTDMLAAQGRGKDMTKWLDQWKEDIHGPEHNDQAAFLQAIGQGM